MSSSFDSHSQRLDSYKRAWPDHRRLILATDRTCYRHPTVPNSPAMPPEPNPDPTHLPFTSSNPTTTNNNNNKLSLFQNKRRSLSFSGALTDDELVASVVPPVTVVLEGRSICHRISLHKHDSYQSFARAIRQMFAVDDQSRSSDDGEGGAVDLSNAVPGHLIAYEDMENDLLLAGDLIWKDFVRVARRIRIMPAKVKCSRKILADKCFWRKF